MDNLFMILLLIALIAIPVFLILGVVKKNKEHFKKAGIAGLVAVISFAGVGIFGDSGDEAEAEEDETAEVAESTQEEESVEEVEEVKEEKTEYGLDEWWEVEDQWRLKVDSVTFTDDRNSVTDKDPNEVIVIEYTYENLGYESDVQDLFFTPDNVIDSEGKVSATYPGRTETSPKPTPIGATTEGAQDVYGITSKEGDIRIHFEKYDNDMNKQKAVFVISLPTE